MDSNYRQANASSKVRDRPKSTKIKSQKKIDDDYAYDEDFIQDDDDELEDIIEEAYEEESDEMSDAAHMRKRTNQTRDK